jgi:predicted transcriptional regulator of viral defense system
VQVWRGATRVSVSDRERTIADALVDPTWVGGARHLIDIVRAYRASSDWNPTQLLIRVAEVARGSAYKRLGYLAEDVIDGGGEIIDACLKAKSKGTIKLDPSIATRGRLIKRWGIWVNAGVADREEPT